MGFKLTDRIGFSPPFDFQPDLEPPSSVDSEKKSKVHLRIRFVPKSKANKYSNNYIRDLGVNDFIIIASKSEDSLIKKHQVSSFENSGITHKDIRIIHQIGLGVNLIKAIEEKKEISHDYVVEMLDWLGIEPESKYRDWGDILRQNIYAYVEAYPSAEKFKPPNELEQVFSIFQLCIKLGIIDISNMSGFISQEIFFALANTIRTAKLSEAQWNPYVFSRPNDPNIEPGSAKYNPLFNDFSEMKTGINLVFDSLWLDETSVFQEEEFSKKTSKQQQLENLSNDFKNALSGTLNDIIIWIRNFINNALSELRLDLIDDVETIGKIIRLYNAYVVGFVNGFIEFLAAIVEGIGSIISLFNFETMQAAVQTITGLINNFNWSEIKTLLITVLRNLFNFIDGDDIYKNAKEFGEFIPKLAEIIIDFIFIFKGVAKKVVTLKELLAKMPNQLKNANIAISELVSKLKLVGFDKKAIKALNEQGITTNVNLLLSKNLNASLGVPLKVIEGRIITISYEGTVLKTFKKKDLEAQKYIKRLNEDKTFLDDEIVKGLNKQRNNLRNTNLIFKETDEWFSKNRAKFMLRDQLDIKKIKKLWKNHTRIIKRELIGNDLQELSKIKNSKNYLRNKNIAKAKVQVEINGVTYEFDYIEHAGSGRQIKGSKGSPTNKSVKDTEFFDTEYQRTRNLDSETKIIELINEDISNLATQKGVPIESVKVKYISLKSTYDPCNVCKKELLLLQERYKTTIEVFRPFYVDEKGVRVSVKNNDNFIKIN